MGGTAREMAQVAYQLGRVDLSTAMIFAMHCQQSAAIIEHASPALRADVLRQVATGQIYLASVTTEQKTGGDLLTASASASLSSGELTIDRFAPVCTGGAVADAFLISVLSPLATAKNQTSLVYATRAQIDVESVGGWTPVGMRATASAPLRLTGSVPFSQVVGEDGGFRDVVVRTFAPLGHIGWAASWLGCADGALSRVVRSLRRRGSNLSDLDRRRLARVRLRSDAMHSMLTQAIDVHGRGTQASLPGQLLINGLKVFCSEQALEMVEELITLVGLKHGYMTDSPLGLERAWRDLRSAPLNFSNDRLIEADGALALMDAETCHV
jgi:acyl-CoA dehydrogenase